MVQSNARISSEKQDILAVACVVDGFMVQNTPSDTQGGLVLILSKLRHLTLNHDALLRVSVETEE